MLFGEYFHNIDQKGRMNFPSRMRDELGERFVVTLWSDNCLAVFSETEWERILSLRRARFSTIFSRMPAILSLINRAGSCFLRIFGIAQLWEKM